MKLYVAQVRSASVESPSAKDINYLEMVQKFGIRICSKDYHESYQICWISIPSLQNRRRAVFVFMYLLRYCYKPDLCVSQVSVSLNPPWQLSRNYNPYAYRVPRAHLNGL